VLTIHRAVFVNFFSSGKSLDTDMPLEKQYGGASFVPSLQERPLPEDPQSRKDVMQVIRDGYIILENSFSLDDAAEAKAEIDRLSGQEPEVGRNPFEGLKTNRIYALLNKYVRHVEYSYSFQLTSRP
jgi:hypothetical protein